MRNHDPLLQKYLNEIAQTPLLTIQEEIELAARIKLGDDAARDHMIRANLRLVVKIASGYMGYGLALPDLIAEGNIGLMKAVERYDPNKGGKVSTYAAWWIKQGVRRALANQSRTIRLPVHAADQVSKMRRTTHALTEELGRPPSDEEVAKRLDVNLQKLNHLREISRSPISLDSTPFDDGDDGTTVSDRVADTRNASPDEQASGNDMAAHLQPLLESLSPRERKIIAERFGLNGKKPRTLAQVGVNFGVTRERIRQLQNRALAKMRSALAQMEDPDALEMQGFLADVRDRETLPAGT